MHETRRLATAPSRRHVVQLQPSLFLAQRRTPRRPLSSQLRSQSDDEDSPQAGPPPPYKVVKEAANVDIESLVNQYKRKELNLKPVYQRGFVWDIKMASNLVLTVLKGLPVPQITVHVVTGQAQGGEDGDDTTDVIDGKQRLTSLLSFVTGDKMGWSSAPVVLELAKVSADGGPGKFAWYHGKRFVDLPSNIQKAVLKTSINVLTIGKETDPLAIFDMYKSLNSGGIKCSDQQLRRAAFFGTYVKLLDSLANYERFKSILAPKSPSSADTHKRRAPSASSRGSAAAAATAAAAAAAAAPATPEGEAGDKEEDRELILRFFAMKRSADGDRFRAPMLNFLNEEIRGRMSPGPQEVADMERQFRDALDVAFSIWGPKAFRKFDPVGRKYETSFNKALWDTVMVVLSEAVEDTSKKKVIEKIDAIKSGFEDLFLSDDWKAALTLTTAKNLKLRRSKLKEVIDGAAPARRQPRAFPYEVKLQKFEEDPRCALCRNAISDILDAEVDHILPYALGGLTEVNNAQLVHRTCNRSKGARVPPGD